MKLTVLSAAVAACLGTSAASAPLIVCHMDNGYSATIDFSDSTFQLDGSSWAWIHISQGEQTTMARYESDGYFFTIIWLPSGQAFYQMIVPDQPGEKTGDAICINVAAI